MNKPVSGWSTIDWKYVNRVVFEYQAHIYAASKQNDMPTVRTLQNQLIRGKSARLLAVRRVTQDNQGKNTPGVDGIKSLPPEERLKLVDALKLTGKSTPVRRIYVPKPNSEEKRPLGIPTIYDRALQALALLAIEPEWEARFEPNSYGFRPGRNCHDAIKMIKNALQKKAKYILDADIAKCFDTINHNALLDKLAIKGKLGRQTKSWLKAGIIDQNIFSETIQGTPQGGIISPLLANVALHGMENAIKEHLTNRTIYDSQGKAMRTRDKLSSLSLVRYADDFVIIHESLEIVLECRDIIINQLRTMGLELKPEKTKIKHTLYDKLSDDKKAGFDFLGFTIQHRNTTKSSSYVAGKQLGYQLIITPSKKSQQKYQKRISEIIRKHASNTQEALILELNPVIRGWSRYFAVSDAKKRRYFAKT
jgi:RNA-directed DNA polymerase